MQLIQNQELQTFGCSHEAAFDGPCQQQLQHHEVREQDVGRIRTNALPLVLALLARVAGKRDERAREAMGEELLSLAKLAICQGVHRVDDDGLDSRLAWVPK